MAVEILQEVEAGYSFASDWWSLGCLLFECLTGIQKEFSQI
jgi:serine/threonine protein kinase